MAPVPAKSKRAQTAKAKEKARLKAQNWVVDGTEYVLGNTIGTGAFATVYLATHTPTSKVVVVKRLDRAKPEQMRQVILRQWHGQHGLGL